MEHVVTISKLTATQGMDYFLRNFSYVPDDKLDWKPAPTAKSARMIAAHTALFAGRFAAMIREQKLPAPENLEAWLEQRKAEEDALVDREEIIQVFRAGTDEVLVALDALTPKAITSILDSGSGWTMSMSYLMRLPGWHATLHAGQIDYLQTCWGDEKIYVE